MNAELMLDGFGCANPEVAVFIAEALLIMADERSDLAIVDFMLGSDSAHALIAAARVKDAHLVIMTGLSPRERNQLAMYGYPVIEKPFFSETLAVALTAALNGRNPK